MMNAIYIRTSSADQTETRQLDHLIAKMGDTPYRVFEDLGVSGVQDFCERPAGSRLMSAIESGKITTCYFHELSRCGRDTANILMTLTRIAELGCQVIIEKENIRLLGEDGKIHPTSQLTMSILSAVSQLERSQLRSRQKEGIAIARLDPTKYTGRQKGTTESVQRFLSKDRSIRIAKLLDDGFKISHIAKILSVSPITVRKVKKLTASAS